MQTKLYLLTTVFVIALLQACQTGQPKATNPEAKLIEEKIEMYFNGWLTGDTTLLGKAMHATCQLKNIKDGEVLIFDRATYLGFFKPRPKLENAGGKILDIDITGTVGSVKIELETAQRLFTDYFNLMKVNGEWFIVDKISTNVAKEEKK